MSLRTSILHRICGGPRVDDYGQVVPFPFTVEFKWDLVDLEIYRTLVYSEGDQKAWAFAVSLVLVSCNMLLCPSNELQVPMVMPISFSLLDEHT